MNLFDLQKEIPYKWKIQSFNYDKTKASCVAYINARDVEDLLDQVVGPENWQDKYEFVGDKIIAGIGIKCGKEWIWKHDTGTESQSEGEKGIFSDAFKRAAVKWGIGRFLYSLDIQWVNIKDKKPVDDKGKRIWDLTRYIEDNKKEFPNSLASNYKILKMTRLAKEMDREEKLQSAIKEKFDKDDVNTLTNREADAIIKGLENIKNENNTN